MNSNGSLVLFLSEASNFYAGDSGASNDLFLRNRGKNSQSITFTSTVPINASVGGSYTVSATASSNLPVSFASNTTSVCTVANSIVSFVASGTCTVQASQAGNDVYEPAPNVFQSFEVKSNTGTKQNQTVTFTSASPSSAAIGSTYTVSATASSGLAVSFSSATPNVCTVSNSTVSFIAAGACTASASQGGDASYNAAPTVSQNITVTADPATPATSTYTIGFENAPTNRILNSLRVGQGITGPATSGRIAVSGKRIIRGKYYRDNYAKFVDLYGSKRLIVAASKSGTTPNPRGGRMQFAFNAGAGFGSGSVTVKSITLSNVTANGASIKFYRGRTLIRTVEVPVTGPGESITLTIDEPGVTILSAFARFPMAVDDLVVSQ